MVTVDTFKTKIANVRAQRLINFDGKVLLLGLKKQQNFDRQNGIQYYLGTLVDYKNSSLSFKQSS